MIVIHYTAMDSADAACRTLCNPETQVSAHYLIDTDGAVRSLVAEEMRAWHAGAGAWGAVNDVNSRSIGIELSNDGFSPFAASQMDALTDLLGGIIRRWAIAPARVIGHSDMAPTRKIDPGPRFDWKRLALEGLSVWPSADMTPVHDVSDAAFLQAAARFGYVHPTAAQLLGAFRLRFRPWAAGPLNETDMRMITNLADRFAVDAKPPSA